MPNQERPNESRPLSWPSLQEQLAISKVTRGSRLEQLIRDNQDFELLRPEEQRDNLRLPLWLRVYWRKAHPEGAYSSTDPSGGYPRTLQRIYVWMLKHPNFVSEK